MAGGGEKRGRALVVMATGLGKTLVAALDAEACLGERGGPPFRVLVLAHALGHHGRAYRLVLEVERTFANRIVRVAFERALIRCGAYVQPTPMQLHDLFNGGDAQACAKTFGGE